MSIERFLDVIPSVHLPVSECCKNKIFLIDVYDFAPDADYKWTKVSKKFVIENYEFYKIECEKDPWNLCTLNVTKLQFKNGNQQFCFSYSIFVLVQRLLKPLLFQFKKILSVIETSEESKCQEIIEKLENTISSIIKIHPIENLPEFNKEDYFLLKRHRMSPKVQKNFLCNNHHFREQIAHYLEQSNSLSNDLLGFILSDKREDEKKYGILTQKIQKMNVEITSSFFDIVSKSSSARQLSASGDAPKKRKIESFSVEKKQKQNNETIKMKTECVPNSSLESVFDNLDLFVLEEPEVKKPLVLPCYIELNYKHPFFGKVQVVAKLWFVDPYGKDGCNQPPESDLDPEFFCFQSGLNKKGQEITLTTMEPVRVCFFHCIEAVYPALNPLQQFVGRWFSSLNVSARLMDLNERGKDVWKLLGNSTFPLKMWTEGFHFNNNIQLLNKIYYPYSIIGNKTSAGNVHARDLIAWLCFEECNEIRCVMHSGMGRTETPPCHHGVVHVLEPEEIDPMKIKFNKIKAIHERDRLTHKWLTTSWGKRITFLSMDDLNAIKKLKKTYWFQDLFKRLKEIDSYLWPFKAPFSYRVWPILGPNLVQNEQDVSLLQQYFHFVPDSMAGISIFSKIKLPEKQKHQSELEFNQLMFQQKLYGSKADVTFLTCWMVKKNEMNLFKDRTDDRYMTCMYVPIRRSLLKSCNLIEYEPGETIEKKFNQWDSEQQTYIPITISVATNLHSKQFIADYEKKSESKLSVQPNSLRKLISNVHLLENKQQKYDEYFKNSKKIELDSCLEFIQLEEEIDELQMKILPFYNAEETLMKGAFTTINHFREKKLERNRYDIAQNQMYQQDNDILEIQTLKERKRQEEIERIKRINATKGPLSSWNEFKR